MKAGVVKRITVGMGLVWLLVVMLSITPLPVLADDEVPRCLIAGQTLLDQAVGRQRLRGGRVNGHAFSASGRWGGTPES